MLKATKGNVFIRAEWDKEISDIILTPENRKGRDIPDTGTVISIGGKPITKKGVVVEPEFKVGDRVLFRKFSGLLVDWEGETLVQVRQHDVHAVLTDG